jgi:hypothetical protein
MEKNKFDTIHDIWDVSAERQKEIVSALVRLTKLEFEEAVKYVRITYSGNELMFAMFLMGEISSLIEIRQKVADVSPELENILHRIIHGEEVSINVERVALPATGLSSWMSSSEPKSKYDIN